VSGSYLLPTYKRYEAVVGPQRLSRATIHADWMLQWRQQIRPYSERWSGEMDVGLRGSRPDLKQRIAAGPESVPDWRRSRMEADIEGKLSDCARAPARVRVGSASDLGWVVHVSPLSREELLQQFQIDKAFAITEVGNER